MSKTRYKISLLYLLLLHLLMLVVYMAINMFKEIIQNDANIEKDFLTQLYFYSVPYPFYVIVFF